MFPLGLLLHPIFPSQLARKTRPRPPSSPRRVCFPPIRCLLLGIRFYFGFRSRSLLPLRPWATPRWFSRPFDSWRQVRPRRLFFCFQRPFFPFRPTRGASGARCQSTHILACFELFWPIFSWSPWKLQLHLSFPPRLAQEHPPEFVNSCEAYLFLGSHLVDSNPLGPHFWKQSFRFGLVLHCSSIHSVSTPLHRPPSVTHPESLHHGCQLA